MKSLHMIPLAAVVACSASKPAPQPMQGSTEAGTSMESSIIARVEPLVRDHWVGAIAIAVVDEHGEHYVSIGEARPGAPADPDTTFEIGSVSKTFTALALAAMVEDKTLALDAEVRTLLPASVTIPSRDGRAITLADLATHTSGLPRLPTNFAPSNPRDPYVDYDSKKLYEFLGSYSLPRAPGATYEYSNIGFGLLGHALATKSGTTYGALLQKRVFAPLGMTATTVDDPKSGIAIGHDADGNEMPAWHFDAVAGAGAIRSTARDMAKYVRAQLGIDKTALSSAITLTQTSRHALDPAASGSIGLGWHIGPSGTVWHNGETGGAHSFVALDLQKHVGIVVLASGATSMIDRVAKDVMGIARGETPGPSPIPETITLPASDLDACIGTYKASPEMSFKITHRGSQLAVQATGQARLGLYALAADRFYLRAVDAEIRFVREGDKVTKLVLVQGGAEIPAPRS